MVNPIHSSLSITICTDVADAIRQGFNYAAPAPGERPVKPIEIKNVVVVRNGTEGGNSTVDLVLEDDSGQRFVCMVTGNLLKSIPC